MRNEQEMMSLILSTAKEDPRIQAVYMNGSRTNPLAEPDPFQDYDIVYIVEETQSFQQDSGWIDRFGERLYMQLPDSGIWHTAEAGQCYGWLIQFADGNRLDLHVETLAHALENGLRESLCQVLLDPQGILPCLPESSDRSFWVQRPNEEQFQASCNEFWWCLNNAAKGFWREEPTSVQEMLSIVLRPELLRMLSWKAGIRHGFTFSVGKSGKYLKRYCAPSEWEAYLRTYASCDFPVLREAVERACRLFDSTAREVAEGLGFAYDEQEARASWNDFLHGRELRSAGALPPEKAE